MNGFVVRILQHGTVVVRTEDGHSYRYFGDERFHLLQRVVFTLDADKRYITEMHDVLTPPVAVRRRVDAD